ncbi:MAG: PDZ domain-containing protein [Actinobacteria bacterium]|nr:MAG: PDZ domain-containing protein [Actinomycetota bacterium]RIK06366.1 MAG: protease DO family protein [Acidobacteriota bacterium]
MPPIPPIPPSPTPGRSRGGGKGRSALIGAVVGALVAAAVFAALWFAFPQTETVTQADRSGSEPNLVVDPGSALDIQGVIDKVQPSVVTIETGARSIGGVFEGAGSGIVISEEGHILTNNHVIEGASSIEVTFYDGSTKQADLVGSFPDDDVAVVQVRDLEAPTVAAELGSSDSLIVGDDVVAIGNALNLGDEPSVTLGIVSATDRSIDAGTVTLENLIQTDAAINPGNSGGPLVNATGQVVGVNTAIIEDSQNIGFAIAIDHLRPLIDDILAGNGEINADQAFLGVSTSDVSELEPAVKERFGISADSGAVVVDVVPGEAAEQVGLQPGDVIVTINGEEVAGSQDVADAIRAMEPGEEITVAYTRGGEEQTGTSALGRRGD